jgi:hypothetical protein
LFEDVDAQAAHRATLALGMGLEGELHILGDAKAQVKALLHASLI